MTLFDAFAGAVAVRHSEAMRMKPPVPSIPRRATRDFNFRGYAIPAGTLVGVNPVFTHHMPEIWPEPEKFDPMRFTDEAQRARHRFAWVPFGGGRRRCPGAAFAHMEIDIALRTILRELDRLELLLGQIAQVEAERDALLAPSPAAVEPDEPSAADPAQRSLSTARKG